MDTLLRLSLHRRLRLRKLPPSIATELGIPISGAADFAGLTGSVYKERERIHRGLLTRDYYQFRLHAGELQPAI